MFSMAEQCSTYRTDTLVFVVDLIGLS